MLRLLLFIAFLVVPVAEVWLLIQAGEVIGGWQTVGLLILAGVLGSWLVRREGRRAWQALQNAVGSGRLPERELFDGAMVVAGGTLLVAPGFLSDLVGLVFILPFTRPMARRLIAWFFARRIRALAASSPYAPLFDMTVGMPGDGATPPGGRVVHGEVIRDDAGTPGGGPATYPGGPPRLDRATRIDD
jgi:UPF0716 protein FxsA